MSSRSIDTGAEAAGDSRLRDGFATIDGVRLHYVEAGEGPLILFLHGFPEFWYAWRRQLAAFGEDHRAVALDMRGYNLSDKPEGLDAYRMRNLVGDVRGLASHLGHQRFVLVGHDWGGAVAWAFAIRHPELLDRLVIINAPHPLIFAQLLATDARQKATSRYMTQFLDPGTEARLSADDFAALAKWVIEPGLAQGCLSEREGALYRAAWAQPGALTGSLNYYRNQGRAKRVEVGTAEFDDPDAFRVRVPTLVIWGLKDRYLLPANLEGLDRLVPDLEIHQVADADHWVVHQQPDLVNQRIRAFLAAERS